MSDEDYHINKMKEKEAEEKMAKYDEEDFEYLMSKQTCWWTKGTKDDPQFEHFDPRVVYEEWKSHVTKGHPQYYRPELFGFEPFDPEEYEREMFRKQEEGTFEWEISDEFIEERGGNLSDGMWFDYNKKRKENDEEWWRKHKERREAKSRVKK